MRIKPSFKRPGAKLGTWLHKKPIKRATGQIKGKKAKVASISKLIKACDKEFSTQVRSRLSEIRSWMETDLDSNHCFTCGKVYPIKKLHCGHYLSRYYKAARWDFDNCRPQCMMCNLWKRGDPIVFRQNLINEIGLERVEAVEAKRAQPIKLSREFLEDLLIHLKK